MPLSRQVVEDAIALLHKHYETHAGINRDHIVVCGDGYTLSDEMRHWLNTQCRGSYRVLHDGNGNPYMLQLQFSEQGDLALYKLRWFGAD